LPRPPSSGSSTPRGRSGPSWSSPPKPGAEITLEEIREIVSQIPRTSVGKFDKKVIRASYADVYGGATAQE